MIIKNMQSFEATIVLNENTEIQINDEHQFRVLQHLEEINFEIDNDVVCSVTKLDKTVLIKIINLNDYNEIKKILGIK